MIKKEIFKNYLLEFPNFLSIFLLPVFFLSPSPMLIEISKSLRVNTSDLILIFSFFTVGVIIGQSTSIIYNIKFSRLKILLGSYAVLIIITLILSQSNSLYTFYILYFVSGYLIGVIWIQAYGNILESVIKNKERLTFIALSCYPLGAFAAPFISTILVSNKINWKFLYYLIAFLIIVAAGLYLITKEKTKYKIKSQKKEKISLYKIFTNKDKNILFIIIVLVGFIYSIVETIISAWSPTFLRLEKMLDISAAGIIASIFWIAVIIGRVIVSILAGRVQRNILMLVLAIITASSILFIVLSAEKYLIFLGVFFAGLGCSAIFPLVVSSGNLIYTKGRGVLITILITLSNFGASIAPYLIRSGTKYNNSSPFFLSIIFMSAVIIMLIIYIIYEKRSIKKS